MVGARRPAVFGDHDPDAGRILHPVGVDQVRDPDGVDRLPVRPGRSRSGHKRSGTSWPRRKSRWPGYRSTPTSRCSRSRSCCGPDHHPFRNPCRSGLVDHEVDAVLVGQRLAAGPRELDHAAVAVPLVAPGHVEQPGSRGRRRGLRREVADRQGPVEDRPRRDRREGQRVLVPVSNAPLSTKPPRRRSERRPRAPPRRSGSSDVRRRGLVDDVVRIGEPVRRELLVRRSGSAPSVLTMSWSSSPPSPMTSICGSDPARTKFRSIVTVSSCVERRSTTSDSIWVTRTDVVVEPCRRR